MKRGIFHHGKIFLVRLALVALVLRALVPVGWMLDTAQGVDGTWLVFCTGQGAVMRFVGADGMPVEQAPAAPAHRQSNDGGHCIFATAALFALPGNPAHALPQRPGDHVDWAPRRRALASADSRFRPFARGPPLAAAA